MTSVSSKILWILGSAVILIAVWGNSYYSEVALLYRTLIVIALLILGLAIIRFTIFGNSAYNLIVTSLTEIRKVVWPNRAETTQTTLIVLAAVIVASLLLWGLDSLFSFGLNLLLG
jgi:preprotein translocase subunit SecE